MFTRCHLPLDPGAIPDRDSFDLHMARSNNDTLLWAVGIPPVCGHCSPSVSEAFSVSPFTDLFIHLGGIPSHPQVHERWTFTNEQLWPRTLTEGQVFSTLSSPDYLGGGPVMRIHSDLLTGLQALRADLETVGSWLVQLL